MIGLHLPEGSPNVASPFAQRIVSGEFSRPVEATSQISQLFQAVGVDPIDNGTFKGSIGHLK